MSAVWSLSGRKRTWRSRAPTSEFDPHRTSDLLPLGLIESHLSIVALSQINRSVPDTNIRKPQLLSAHATGMWGKWHLGSAMCILAPSRHSTLALVQFHQHHQETNQRAVRASLSRRLRSSPPAAGTSSVATKMNRRRWPVGGPRRGKFTEVSLASTSRLACRNRRRTGPCQYGAPN